MSEQQRCQEPLFSPINGSGRLLSFAVLQPIACPRVPAAGYGYRRAWADRLCQSNTDVTAEHAEIAESKSEKLGIDSSGQAASSSGTVNGCLELSLKSLLNRLRIPISYQTLMV